MEGTPFGRYRLVELLGRGGMGEVWRAFDTVTERTVAIKVLPIHLADDNAFQQRFRREAKAAAGLDEPHVVPIFDFGEIEGRLYVAMRLIQGQDLQDLLSEGPLQPAHAVRIIEQIASALHAAHQIGLVHRDVKPSNILITRDDFAYLIDFGIARAAGETSLTSSSVTIGTWAYMAPERFKGIADARADVYALACVLYQSLTSKLPFPGESLEQLATAHMFEPPPQPSVVQDGVPPAMDQVIATGMAKDPDQRYQTAKDLARAARVALTTREQAQADTIMADTQAAPTTPAPVGSDASEADAVPSQGHSGDKEAGKSRLIAVVAAVVAVIVSAGLIVIWRPWERQPSPRPRESPGPMSSTTQPITTTMTTTVQPPPPPSFPPKGIDQVLLTADQLTKLLGVSVTTDPAGGGAGTAIALNSSSYGMSDHSGQVTPRSCVGVVFTGEHDVYAAADPAAIKTQTFGTLYQIPGLKSYLFQQTAAVFASAEQAQRFLSSSQPQWETCSRSDVGVELGFENSRGYTLGTVQRQGDLISVKMASPAGENPVDACQQALGAQENVVVETRSCAVPNNTKVGPPYSDPNWATNDAERIAKAMLQNVTP
jgi:serine/threonine protein kinase